MERDDDQRLPAELVEMAERMRDERPALAPLELDELRLRIRGRVARGSHRKEPFMRSRIAITSMLLLGVFLTVGGTGLAVTGLSGQGSAAKSEYGHHHHHHNNNGNGNNANSDTEGTNPAPTLQQPQAGVLPATGSNPTQGVLPETKSSPTRSVQPARQVQSAQLAQLPFTGFAAIPIMLIGLALLTAGLLTRRQVRRDQA